MKAVYNFDGEMLAPRNYVTPEMYGAVGNGIKDDSNAFKEMLAGGNKIVQLKPTTYKIAGSINVYSNTVINGNHAFFDCSKPAFVIGESGDYAYDYDGSNNVEINNITFDLHDAQTDHIIMAHAQNVRIANCTFLNNVEHSIELNSSKNVLIENCIFRNIAPSTVSKEAINIDPAHTGATLNMGYFDDTISDCVKIISCLFENCWCPVGNHNETPYASRNIIFKNNDVRGCYRGAQLHSYGNIFIENNFFDVSEKGIRLVAAHDVTIAGNNIVSEDSAISVESTTENVFIRDNIIDTDSETPISIVNTASRIITAQNIINDALVN